jgi:dynactin-6
VKIAAGAVVCAEQTQLVGDVTIGCQTIVHPTSSIKALKGPIIIGESNIIEERVSIVNNSEKPLVIGSFNVFEVGSHSESQSIGDHNVLEYKSVLGRKTILTTGCIIGAKCHVETDEILQPNTVIFGSECRRRTQSEKPVPQTNQRDFLTKILPNYQRLEKSNFVATPSAASVPAVSPQSE